MYFRVTCVLTATANEGHEFVYFFEDYSHAYRENPYVFVVTQCHDGYGFEKWTEDGVTLSTNSEFWFPVTSERNIEAHFFKRTYTVTASADPEEGGVVEGGGVFNYGETCVLVTQEANYVACYAPRSYLVFVNANPSNGGFVSGSGTYVINQECTVTAIAADGFRFVAWMEDGDTVSTDSSYDFVVHGNSNLVANFIQNTGVEEALEAVCLFPNPIETGGTLRVSGGSRQFDALALCDLCGRTLFEATGDTTGGLTVTLPDTFAPGCYLVRLTQDNKVVRYEKLLVR